jgi:DNA-binding NtrC family response regulator
MAVRPWCDLRRLCESLPDGDTFLRTLEKQGPPELLITDIDLGGLSGVELLAVIRNRWLDLPVILISGGSTARQPDTDTDNSVWFLAKPFDVRDLSLTVSAALDRSETTGMGALGGHEC